MTLSVKDGVAFAQEEPVQTLRARVLYCTLSLFKVALCFGSCGPLRNGYVQKKKKNKEVLVNGKRSHTSNEFTISRSSFSWLFHWPSLHATLHRMPKLPLKVRTP